MQAERTGTRSPSKNSRRETQGLTDSSSATEAGEDRRKHGKELAASLCSLERVVRPAPTEGLLDRRNSGVVPGASGKPVGGPSGPNEAPGGQNVHVFAILRLREACWWTFWSSEGSGRPVGGHSGRPKASGGLLVDILVVRREKLAGRRTFWPSRASLASFLPPTRAVGVKWSRETQGLTNSSSATEAGHARRRSRKRRDGQPLFAGARG